MTTLQVRTSAGNGRPGSMKAAVAVIAASTAMLFWHPGAPPDAIAAQPRLVVRQEDIAAADPVINVTGNWTAPPVGRAVNGQTFYLVQITCFAEDSGPSTIAIGVLDAPELPAPIVVSSCTNCYDPARGAPAPEGWQPLANHGVLDGPTTFKLNFDGLNRRWGWYVNGRLVRLEESRLLGTGMRVSAGVSIDADGEVVREMWHHDLRFRQDRGGWRLFEPNDDQWPQVTIDGTTLSYYPTGTVVVHAGEPPITHPDTVLPSGRQRGGGAGPVVSAGAGGPFLVARGPDLLMVDPGRGRVLAAQHFTSTVTASAAVPGGFLAGLQDGTVVRLDEDDQAASGDRLSLGAAISALAAAGNDAMAATVTGDVYRLVLAPKLTVSARASLDGQVRFFQWLGGRWVAGVELPPSGGLGGYVTTVKQAGVDQLAFGGPVQLPNGPLASVALGSASLLVALTWGELWQIDVPPAADDLVDGGPVLVLQGSSTVRGMVGSGDRAYVLGDDGTLWTVATNDSGVADTVATHQLGLRGGRLALAGTYVVATSDDGRIAAYDLDSGFAATPVLADDEVGAVSSVLVGDDGAAVLAGRWAVERLSTGVPNLPLLARAPLLRRGVALRPWSGGIAVAEGGDGVDFYDWPTMQLVSHLALPGASRDLVILDDVGYVASGVGGVHVVSLKDPRQPAVVSTMATPFLAASVAVTDTLLLVGQQGGNVLAYDRSAPDAPQLIGEVPETPNVVRLVVHATDVFGLSPTGHVFRLHATTAPATSIPQLVGAFRGGRYGLDLAPATDSILVASGSDGMQQAGPADQVATLRDALVGPVTAVGMSARWTLAGMGPAGLAWWPMSQLNVVFMPTLGRDK